MTKIEKLINKLLEDSEIAMVPYHNGASDELKELYNFFIKTNKDMLYKQLINIEDHPTKINNAVNIILHYKGKFSFFDTSIDFNTYQKVKSWLDDESKNIFRMKFYKEYGQAVIRDELDIIEEDLLELILKNDITLYMQIAKKLNIPNATINIFNNHQDSIFEWLNMTENMYQELIKLNQPNFILNNMSGKLDISDASIKYIVENAESSLELYIAIKRKIGLEALWKLSHHRFKPEFYVDIAENIDEFIFVINIPNMSLVSLESILNKIKVTFPHIYDNFNSLLFVKKEFNNK